MSEKDNKIAPSVTGTQPVVNTPDEKPPVVEKMPVAESPKKEGVVEVSKDVLDSILREISELKTKTEQYEQTASQDQIRKIEAMRASGKLVKSVKLRRFEGKLVLGTKLIRDEVWVADGKLHENQVYEIYFDDGSTNSMSLIQFERGCTYESYEVIKESKTATGDLEFTVMLRDGREMVVNSKFVN